LVGRAIELRKICKGIKQGLDERFPGNQIKIDFDLIDKGEDYND
jgi:hypothetical protein